MTRTFQCHLLAAALGVAMTALPLAAQVAGPSGAPPASQPASEKPAANQSDATPASSLDDLLKIDQEKPDASKPAADSAQDAAADAARRELDKELSEAEVANAFVQAVEQMGVAASLLDSKFDTGLGTQRVQEDIIAKLSQLLDQAKKNKSSSSSSSSSSSRRQQNKQQQNPGQRQNQQNQQQQQGDQRNNNPSDNRSEMDPPAPQDANANAPLEESRAEWGNLPQRVRDMLLQGRKEKFSTLYEQLTYEYYKRLAEEGSP